MALTEIIFGSPRLAQIGLVQLDASVSENHGKSAEVTRHPIEDGSTVSDHIIRQPDTLTIQGIVSNHPLVFLASIQAPSPLENDLSPASERAELAFAELERVMEAGETVDVVTTFKEYTNMGIESISVTRDAERGNIMDATIQMVEVVTAQLETVALPDPEVPSNKAPVDKGTKPPTPATPQNESFATAGIKAVFGGP